MGCSKTRSYIHPTMDIRGTDVNIYANELSVGICKSIRLKRMHAHSRRKIVTPVETRLKKCATVEFLTAKCCGVISICRRMAVVYGSAYVVVRTVIKWARIAKGGNPSSTNLHDHACS